MSLEVTNHNSDEVLASREYAWLREFKSVRGRDLRSRYGAHALGIGWAVPPEGTSPRPVLRFYVAPGRALSGDPIPDHFEWTPSGESHPVRVPTEVVESEPAELE